MGGYPLQPYLSEQQQHWINVVVLQSRQYDIFVTEIFSVKAKKSVSVYIKERKSEIGSLEILTSSQMRTSARLQKQLERGWNICYRWSTVKYLRMW